MELNKQQIESFNKNGFVHISNYLDKTKVDEIKANSKLIFLNQIKALNISVDPSDDESFEQAAYELFNKDYVAFIGAAKLCQHDLALHRMATGDKVIDAVKHFGVRNPAICVKPIVYFNSRYLAKMVGHYKTPPHQDWRSMQGSVNSMVVWIPLVDIDKDLGALEVIPGSHLKGLYKTEKDEWFRTIKDDRFNFDDFAALEVKRGDVVCFNSFLIHQSGDNITSNIRWSMHFRYNDIDESTFVARKYPHPYVVYRPDQDIIYPEFHTEIAVNKYFNGIN